jgi:hypothetical protein
VACLNALRALPSAISLQGGKKKQAGFARLKMEITDGYAVKKGNKYRYGMNKLGGNKFSTKCL